MEQNLVQQQLVQQKIVEHQYCARNSEPSKSAILNSTILLHNFEIVQQQIV